MRTHVVIRWLTLVGLLLLAACSSDNNATNTLGTDPYADHPDGSPVVQARFDGVKLPLPNDVTWADNGGVCPDGQVCLPIDPVNDSAAMQALKTGVNSLGLLGLSPNMFLTIPMTGVVDTSTLELLAFRTDAAGGLPTLLGALAGGDPTTIGAALAAMEFLTQDDFVADTSGTDVKLLPKTPLVAGASYAVIVKTGLLDAAGYPVLSSATMNALKSTVPFDVTSPFYPFEALRAAFNDDASPTAPALFTVTQAVTAALNGGIPWTRTDTLVLWPFHTAAITLTVDGSGLLNYSEFADVAATFKSASLVYPAGGNDLTWTNPATGADTGGAALGIPAADYFAGTPVPNNYLDAVYSGYFQSPVLSDLPTTTDSVPFVLTTPAGATPPYPLVVFQHGITSHKEVVFGIANSLAAAGYAALAIDAPLHGERTAPGASSGDGFLTANILMSRANFYQAAIDLWETFDVIGAGIDLGSDGIPDLDSGNVAFLAHSLGSMLGSVCLSQETRVNDIILSSPASGLINVLDVIAMPSVQQIVSDLGYVKGTTPYYIFLDLAQWLMDPVDSAYNGIGDNSTDNLLSVFAYGDPIVPPSSSLAFVAGLSRDPRHAAQTDPAPVTVVDPDDPIVPITDTPPWAPAPVAGTYQYGVSGQPIVHSFMLSPAIDLVEEPYYTGYSPTDQVNATNGVQTQVFGYLYLATQVPQ